MKAQRKDATRMTNPRWKGKHMVVLAKGSERYLFVFDAASRDETIRTSTRFAENPDLSFTYYDASVLAITMHQRRGK